MAEQLTWRSDRRRRPRAVHTPCAFAAGFHFTIAPTWRASPPIPYAYIIYAHACAAVASKEDASLSHHCRAA
ncbi:hypothetical protein HYPSUDRAFT_70738 [Hypholoma sublateritium FD-334 SS-4]|uniref:Uncharacterized protein n=1 Tax=Hypholoma sublateritium (strain FD-334 SS-4) TaxID=945553 RepID=A0A0D2M2T4_HYPSF|nr:hypothetical protein HYPSUDRAFT_70738 [Hypholoma sublateritium FD-334 SS-4]